ncbi:MAG: hypothetical protein KME11_19385 [Timaviella obliquedivisa GSE-PSE-MK23-08B]|nr:hypothetical protein [Timaviella obliquedivisa GSE-PSE-MK23-08B]
MFHLSLPCIPNHHQAIAHHQSLKNTCVKAAFAFMLIDTGFSIPVDRLKVRTLARSVDAQLTS